MGSELPDLSEYQLDCLRSFLRFEFPFEALHAVLSPLIVFRLDGPTTRQTMSYAAGIPNSPIRVTLVDVESAVEKMRMGEITERRLQQWATMILLNDAFDWSGKDEDAIADQLNKLSS